MLSLFSRVVVFIITDIAIVAVVVVVVVVQVLLYRVVVGRCINVRCFRLYFVFRSCCSLRVAVVAVVLAFVARHALPFLSLVICDATYLFRFLSLSCCRA